MRTNDEQRAFQQIAGLFDEPAFLRRARTTRNAWEFLLARAERKRKDWLKMPAIKLGRLYMLSDKFRLLSKYVSGEDRETLRQQMLELNPKMLRHLPVARDESKIVDELTELIGTYSRFNTRWFAHVCTLNYDRVNELRDGYNKYYVLEKECALMSARTAAAGFQPLLMIGREDVLEVLPLLQIPDFL